KGPAAGYPGPFHFSLGDQEEFVLTIHPSSLIHRFTPLQRCRARIPAPERQSAVVCWIISGLICNRGFLLRHFSTRFLSRCGRVHTDTTILVFTAVRSCGIRRSAQRCGRSVWPTLPSAGWPETRTSPYSGLAMISGSAAVERLVLRENGVLGSER